MKKIFWGLATVSMALLCLTDSGSAFSGSYEEIVMVQDKVVAQFRVTAKNGKVRTENVQGLDVDVVIRNLKGTYRYLPQKKMAFEMPEAAHKENLLDELDDYPDFLVRNDAKHIEAVNLDGEICDVYEFIDPMTKHLSKAWVSKNQSFPMRIEIGTPEGAFVIKMKNVQIGIDISDKVFEIPEDVKVIKLEHLGHSPMAGKDGALATS